jgi:spore maturation protein CgeB
MNYNTNDRLTWYGHARFHEHDKDACAACGEKPTRQALDADGIMTLGMAGLTDPLYKFWPDVIFFISGFYMTAPLLQLIRTRRHKIVMLHTESPYQDQEQMVRGDFADLNLLNDPANIGAWKELDAPVAYMPHAYDPDIHYPNWSPSRFEIDFTFIGTLFRSRAQFFSEMDFTGIDTAFGGSGWDLALNDYPELVSKVVDTERGHALIDYLAHPADHCVGNDETADVYRKTKVGINFYRREGEADQVQGVAMGPREVEMAACGLFFLRDPRPEGDALFDGILPRFHSPEEASELMRYWVTHDEEREALARKAYERVASRTFDNNARAAMVLMEEAGIL